MSLVSTTEMPCSDIQTHSLRVSALGHYQPLSIQQGERLVTGVERTFVTYTENPIVQGVPRVNKINRFRARIFDSELYV